MLLEELLFPEVLPWGRVDEIWASGTEKEICYRVIYARDVFYIYCEVVFRCNEKDFTNKRHYFRAFRRPGCPYLSLKLPCCRSETGAFFVKLFSPNITSQINREKFFPLNGVLGELVRPFFCHPFAVKIDSKTDLA